MLIIEDLKIVYFFYAKKTCVLYPWVCQGKMEISICLLCTILFKQMWSFLQFIQELLNVKLQSIVYAVARLIK